MAHMHLLTCAAGQVDVDDDFCSDPMFTPPDQTSVLSNFWLYIHVDTSEFWAPDPSWREGDLERQQPAYVLNMYETPEMVCERVWKSMLDYYLVPDPAHN